MYQKNRLDGFISELRASVFAILDNRASATILDYRASASRQHSDRPTKIHYNKEENQSVTFSQGDRI